MCVDNHNHRTEKPPPAALGGSDTPAQQARYGPHWAADSALRKLGRQGHGAVFDLFFHKLSPGSAAAVLALGFLPTHFCSCPRTGCKVSPGASSPILGGPHTPLTSVSLLFIGLFTGRAVTGKKERESWGHSSVLRGEPVLLGQVPQGPSHPFAPPYNCPLPNETLGQILFPFPGSCPWRVSPSGCTESLSPSFPLGKLL